MNRHRDARRYQASCQWRGALQTTQTPVLTIFRYYTSYSELQHRFLPDETHYVMYLSILYLKCIHDTMISVYLPNINCVLCRCTSQLRLSGMGEYKNVQNCTINMYLFLHNAQNTYLLQPRQKYFIGKLHKWWQLIFASLPCSSNPRKTFHIQNLYWALPIMARGPWNMLVPIWSIWYQ